MFRDLDNPSKYDDAVLHVDGDIIAYTAASVSDGRCYTVDNFKKKGGRFKYKKEAKEFCDAHGVSYDSIKLDFDPEPLSHALHNIKLHIAQIQAIAPGAGMTIYLTGNENYRKQINPDYKAHRKGMRKPEHLSDCKQYLLSKYSAVLEEGLEADDLMGIGQTTLNIDGGVSIICSIDKDLLTIPGLHYNWRKPEKGIHEVDVDGANTFFYQQCLQGDATDGIAGLRGIGPAKAIKHLEGSVTSDPTDLYIRCMELYFTKHGVEKGELVEDWVDRVEDIFRNTAQLVWIQRVHGETWSCPL